MPNQPTPNTTSGFKYNELSDSPAIKVYQEMMNRVLGDDPASVGRKKYDQLSKAEKDILRRMVGMHGSDFVENKFDFTQERPFQAALDQPVAISVERDPIQLSRGVVEAPGAVGTGRSRGFFDYVVGSVQLPSKAISLDVQQTPVQVLKDLGYMEEGLENLFTQLRAKNIRQVSLSEGNLVIEAGTQGKSRPVHIPLFGKSADVGTAGAQAASDITGRTGMVMFRKGSAQSVVPEIGTIVESVVDEKVRTSLVNVRSFNEYFYEELAKIIEKTDPQNLEKQIKFLLNRQETYMPGLDRSLSGGVTDSVEFSSPWQYSGKRPLGRHLLGFSTQLLLEVPEDSPLYPLLAKEAEARQAFQTGAGVSRQSSFVGTSVLQSTHDKAKQDVLNHIKKIVSDPNANPREAEMAKRLNLMFASQSAEWVFNNAIQTNLHKTGNNKRTFIKVTSAAIKDLSVLPGNNLYEKGRQFYLSAAPVQLNSVHDLPASVANIMGHADDQLESVIPSLKRNVRALGGDAENVAFGMKAVGIQFLDDRLNKAIFGDASAMMSEELAKRLNVDPVTGRGRTVATVNVPLRRFSDNRFEALFSDELYRAIKDASAGMDVTSTINFNTPFALFKHAELGAQLGFDLPADGPVVESRTNLGHVKSGQNIILTDELLQRDLRHSNDILRSIKNRGINPLNAEVQGVRINGSTGEMQLIINDSSTVRMDSGYIFEGQRFSAQNIITEDQKEKILRSLGLDDSTVSQLKRSGLVMGDLGLSQAGAKAAAQGKTSYGLNVTLLQNLAELTRRKGHAGADAAEKITNVFGGSYKRVTAAGDSTFQFSGLGSHASLERMDDAKFATSIKEVLESLGSAGHQDIVDDFYKQSFVHVDPEEILKHTKSFKKAMDDIPAPSQGGQYSKLLRSLGLSDIQASQVAAVVSFGSQVMIREEEPLAKLGTATAKIRVRELMLLSESLDFIDASGMQQTKDFNKKRSRRRLAKDFIRSNRELLMPGHEFSLMLQLHRLDKKGRNFDPKAVLSSQSEFGGRTQLEAIDRYFTDKGAKIGTLHRIDSKALGGSLRASRIVREEDLSQNFFEEKTVVTNKHNRTAAQRAEAERGVDVDKRLISKVEKDKLDSLIRGAKKAADNKVAIGELEGTILGLVKQNAEGSVAVISDQAVIMQGSNGPMLVPSAKTMGFRSEKGFIRISNYVGEEFDTLEKAIAKSIADGESTTEKTKAYYLKILQDVENMEMTRLENEGADDVIKEKAGRIESRLNKLYGYLAQNSLSKAGTFYNAELSSKYVDFAGRFRLQTAPGLEVFEVGLTRDALRRMVEGGRYGQQEALQTKGFGVDAIIKAIESGDDYFLNVYREPIAGGRQMMAMKIKLMDEFIEGGDKFDFGFSAFLHKSMVQYGMDGDFDKDSVTIFRLNSMNKETMQGIYEGQKAKLQQALEGLSEAPTSLLKQAFGQEKLNVGDVNALLNQMESGVMTESNIRIHSIDALLKISSHGHATPIFESFATGRSYLDHMIGLTMDMAADDSNHKILQNNLTKALGRAKGDQLLNFIQRSSQLFARESGDQASRLATYNYTDARNIVKYMFLKKAGHGGERDVGHHIADLLIKNTEEFAFKYGAQEQMAFIDDLLNAGEQIQESSRNQIDELATYLLKAADMIDDQNVIKGLEDIDPKSLSLLHGLANQDDAARTAANHLAREMLYTNAIAALFVSDPAQMPGESILKNFLTVMGRTGGEAAAEFSAMPSAFARSMIQGLTMDEGFIEELGDERTIEAYRSDIKAARAAYMRLGMQDAESDLINRGGGAAGTAKQSYTNSLISGEFFRKFSQSRFFKPAAAIAGGLAAVETIRSSMSSVPFGAVPAGGYASASTMPPPPVMSSPQDPTFNVDAVQNTNVIRLSKSYGQKTRLNVSGKMDGPIDFRGISNQVGLNNGYVANIQGSFNYMGSDTMGSNQFEQFVADKIGSSF